LASSTASGGRGKHPDLGQFDRKRSAANIGVSAWSGMAAQQEGGMDSTTLLIIIL
jgi:hypothetical protein